MANRDSIAYEAPYGLRPEDGLRTMFRGTIRYPGFYDLVYACRQVGLLDTENLVTLSDWQSLPWVTLSKQLSLSRPLTDRAAFEDAIKDILPDEIQPAFHHALGWLTDPTASLPSLPTKPHHPIDLFATLLAHRLRYAPHEHDLVALHHEVITSSPSAGLETHTSSLEVYGDSDASAMARCVGLPVAFSALYILDGGKFEPGVQGPTNPQLYKYILERTGDAGLRMKHTVTPYQEDRSVEGKLIEVWK